MSQRVEAVVNPDERTATIMTRFEQPMDVVWTLWSDPAKLEQWWGPPGVPMAVDHHDLSAGGHVDITVHAAGSVIRGHWSIIAVEPPRSLHFTFTSDGLEATDIDVLIEKAPDATTTMTITAQFTTDQDLRHATEIGFVNGLTRACESAHTIL